MAPHEYQSNETVVLEVKHTTMWYHGTVFGQRFILYVVFLNVNTHHQLFEHNHDNRCLTHTGPLVQYLLSRPRPGAVTHTWSHAWKWNVDVTSNQWSIGPVERKLLKPEKWSSFIWTKRLKISQKVIKVACSLFFCSIRLWPRTLSPNKDTKQGSRPTGEWPPSPWEPAYAQCSLVCCLYQLMSDRKVPHLSKPCPVFFFQSFVTSTATANC